MTATQLRSVTDVPTHPTMRLAPGPFAKLFPFLHWWPLITRRTLKDDLLAGLTGALIVLPQGVAFATIAGLPPEFGLYAAMIPAVVGSTVMMITGACRHFSSCLLYTSVPPG